MRASPIGWCGLLIVGVGGSRKSRHVAAAAETDSTVSPLDVLKRENELLKQTISEAKVSITDLEQSLGDAGVPFSKLSNEEAQSHAIDTADLQPEDFWSPAIEVPEGFEYQDEYGAISPIPDHDGTECFKWDETLWAKADHFKVHWRFLLVYHVALQWHENCVPVAVPHKKHTVGDHDVSMLQLHIRSSTPNTPFSGIVLATTVCCVVVPLEHLQEPAQLY